MAERKPKQQASTPTNNSSFIVSNDEETAPTEEALAPKQTEFKVNGKHTAPGHVVHYTTRLGVVQHATINRLEQQDDGTTQADLDAEVDGRWQRFAGVPHSVDGGVNTWDHAPSED
jgi:hypothetical protein